MALVKVKDLIDCDVSDAQLDARIDNTEALSYHDVLRGQTLEHHLILMEIAELLKELVGNLADVRLSESLSHIGETVKVVPALANVAVTNVDDAGRVEGIVEGLNHLGVQANQLLNAALYGLQAVWTDVQALEELFPRIFVVISHLSAFGIGHAHVTLIQATLAVEDQVLNVMLLHELLYSFARAQADICLEVDILVFG